MKFFGFLAVATILALVSSGTCFNPFSNGLPSGLPEGVPKVPEGVPKPDGVPQGLPAGFPSFPGVPADFPGAEHAQNLPFP